MNDLITTAVFLFILFFLARWLSKKIANLSIVDAVWAFAFAPVCLTYTVLGDGWIWRRVAISAVIVIWSLRLGGHLVKRIKKHHPSEDGRYVVLRKKFPGRYAFFWFFQAQALLVWLLMLPVYLISGNAEVGFSWPEVLGLGLWLVGVIGESIADSQLKSFAASQEGSKEVCRNGLWKYSRHPNYFFQSLLWWGLFLIALPTEYGYFAILAPAAMLFFLLRVTGIPLTEKLSLKKRGEAYRQYQKTTSAFIPLPPKTR